MVRTGPSAICAVKREPVGNSTRTSTDSVGPMMLTRGRGPVIVTRRPSKSTVVSSAPRRSTASDGLVGVTLTTVSVRLLASISSDPTLKGAPTGWKLPVREVRANVGAGFVYPICGDMRTMPGLSAKAAAMSIDIDEDGEIVGLS